MELLDETHKCVQKDPEHSSDYEMSFNGALERYVNQTGAFNYNTGRQFSTLMIKNARLPFHTLALVMFQLSSVAVNENRILRPNVVKLTITDIKAILAHTTEPLSFDLTECTK